MENDLRDRIKCEVEPSDMQREIIYKEFVKSQLLQFESYLNYLNAELCALKRFRIVSNDTKMLARIKSIESATKNDDKDDKELNDVFGLEVGTATMGEYEFLVQLFLGGLYQTKDKIHPDTNGNGYIAHHYSGYPIKGNIVERLREILKTEYDPEEYFEQYIKKLSKKEYEKMKEDEKKKEKGEIEETKEEKIRKYCYEACNSLNNYIKEINEGLDSRRMQYLEMEMKKFEDEYYAIKEIWENGNAFQPVIECQLKEETTRLNGIHGKAAHFVYKKENKKHIQRFYDENGYIPESKLPMAFYRSELKRGEGGIPIPPRKCGYRETITELYPHLNLDPQDGYDENYRENDNENNKGEAK